MMRAFTGVGLSVALICGLLIEPTMAQVVPFKTKGVGSYNPLNGNYGGSGTGTHLGRHTFTGNVATSPTANPLVFDFVIAPSNPQETIAANGDKVYFSGSDQVQLVPLEPTFTVFSAVWLGQFVVEGGTGWFANVAPGPQPLAVVAINESTGKFAGATGSWIMYAYSLPFVLGSTDPVHYWWDGKGSITFKRGP